jgi:YVTN family beta-propeller protein
MAHHRQPTIGVTLADYRIEAFVGSGGMGEVYRAFDTRLNRNVALKVLVPRLADDEGFRQRFLHESRLAASLDHPNVIPVYEAGEAKGRLFIAMRFVEGTDLRQTLDDERVLQPERALALLAPVAGALDTAHAKGLVHRDVKPANILIAAEPAADPPEHVYLSDFGLTTLSSDPRDAGPFTGTADYAAPELVTGGPVDGRTDVYALGCVLFECLTGEPPYQGGSMMAVLWGHMHDPVPSASARNSDLPDGIDDVLRKALAKEPADRHATSRALVEEARDALGLTGVEVPFGARGRRALFAAGIGTALVAAALLAFFLTRGDGAPRIAATGALVRIDPVTNEAKQTIRVGDGPSSVSAGNDGVWVAANRDGNLWRIDPRTLAVTKISSIGAPYELSVYDGRVYVAGEGPGIGTGNVTAYDASNGHRYGGVELLACSIAAGPGGVWAAGCPNVNRLSTGDPLKILKTVQIPRWSPQDAAHDRAGLEDMAQGEGALWVIGDPADRRLWRIDMRRSRVVRTVRLGFVPSHVAAGLGAVWVTDQLDDAVVRLDPASGRVIARIPVGRGASGVAVGFGSIWATSRIDGTVSRIDAGTNRVVATVEVGGSPGDISAGGGSVWTAGDAD